MQHLIVEQDGESNITVIVPGFQPQVAHSDHPNFRRIVAQAEAGISEGIVELFDIAKAAAAQFSRLSERVTAKNGELFLDGDPINNALTNQVVRYLDEGTADWKPLVAFFEKVQSNPDSHSREQLFGWLNARDFTITPEGDILAYRGVLDDLTSKTAGPAIVDGVQINGHVPNNPGSVIEMPRADVEHDPRRACAPGLHVASWNYASGWASKTISVHVNPRDVVSVPTETAAEKVRVCRYKVDSVVDRPITTALAPAQTGFDEHDQAYDNSYFESAGVL